MDLSDLAFFTRLTRHSSLAAAALDLGLSPAAVSRRLAALERRLGVRLLNRTTRRHSLTPEGERYVQDGARILQDMEQLELSLAGARDHPRGVLKVNAGFGFGRRHLAPMISQFMALHPQVEVVLHLTDRPLDLAALAMDVGIRHGLEGASGLMARKLAPNRRLLCAAPSYLAGRPGLDHPARLADHACIFIRENDQPLNQWALVRGREELVVRVDGRLSTNHGEVAVDWALAGHGIVLRSERDIAPYFRSGQLVQVLPDWSGRAADIYAVFLHRHLLSAKVRVFLDFLADQFSAYRSQDRVW